MVYTAQETDTFTEIARKFRSTVKELKELNPSVRRVSEGAEITVPDAAEEIPDTEAGTDAEVIFAVSEEPASAEYAQAQAQTEDTHTAIRVSTPDAVPANIRAAADMTAAVISQVSDGDVLIAAAENEGWRYIPSLDGFLRADLAQEI